MYGSACKGRCAASKFETGYLLIFAFHLLLISKAPFCLLVLLSRRLRGCLKHLLTHKQQGILLHGEPLQQVKCLTGGQVLLAYYYTPLCAFKVHMSPPS